MFNEKSQFRVSIYIYTVLCDSTPEQHEIENYEKKGVKTSQNHLYIYIYVILTFIKAKLQLILPGHFFVYIYIYMRNLDL